VNAPGGGDLREGRTSRLTSAVPRATTMLTWAGVDTTRLEAVRVVLSGRGMRATGSLVAAPDTDLEAHSASYTLAVNEVGVLDRLTVRTLAARGEKHLTLSRSEENLWLVDHGEGAKRTDFDGAVDVNVAFSPLFNALPVRRLGLHRTPAEHDLSTVFVVLPTLDVQLVHQTYRTVSVAEQPVVAFSAGGFGAELTLDTDGLVIDYPGLARRL